MENTTEETKVPKKAKIRANSRMAVIVAAYEAGTTDSKDIAAILKKAEEAGEIKGLKKTEADFLAKKDLNYFVRVVNWYLNQAKHKGLVEGAPIKRRRREKTQDEVVQAGKALAGAEPVAAPVQSAVDGIPTI